MSDDACMDVRMRSGGDGSACPAVVQKQKQWEGKGSKDVEVKIIERCEKLRIRDSGLGDDDDEKEKKEIEKARRRDGVFFFSGEHWIYEIMQSCRGKNPNFGRV